MTAKSILSLRLVELRKSKNLSQKEVAEILQQPERSYRRYELEEHEPKLRSLVALAKLYGVSTDYLLGLVDEP